MTWKCDNQIINTIIFPKSYYTSYHCNLVTILDLGTT